MVERCESCGREFNRITMHWAQAECGYPEFTERQIEILSGLVMGDADVQRSGPNPYVRIRMTNKKFLKWLKEQFGPLATNIEVERTGEEMLESNKKYGSIPIGDNPEYKDLYRLNIRSNPHLQEFSEWYSSGDKVFPDSISFTPLTVKMWYVCDGWYDKSTERPAIRMNNESERIYEHIGRFKQLGLEPTKQGERSVLRFNTSKADAFFDYIGSPVPGFEYKWPMESL